MAALPPRAHAALDALDETTLIRTPPAGGWSIAEVLEHVCLSNESYTGPIRRAIQKTRAAGKTPRTHRPSLIGGWLDSALRSTSNRLPAPGKVRPLAVRANVRAAFYDSLAQVEAAAHEADGLDLCAGFASPLSPLVRMNLGDAFSIAVSHTERHLGQIERVRAALGA